ncbi:MAG: hypothetical protein IJ207_08730 [Treponema sp.]|uniref:hypothetical protein n=1 Tax=Treponema sp. TaxID=166 RepID=UPI0025EC8F92|nr:hypothetical protein [Treponema sp.]MBQ9282266.1 hypothetical protein [Treponema sp.]
MINQEHIKQDLRYIGEILKSGDSLSVKNPEVGFISVDKGNVGKSGNGLQHIIEQRFEKDGKSIDEISAVLALVMNATEDGKVSRNVEIFQGEKDIGTFDIEKNGIISFVSKTRDGKDEKFVITGFDDFSKKDEAGAAIEAVIANNSYAPEFVIVKEQVVATLASAYILHLDELKRNLEKNDSKKVNQELKKIEPYKKSEELKDFFEKSKNQTSAHNPLTDYTVLDVDGMSVECKTGLISGMKNAVRHVMQLQNEVDRLTEENERLKKQSKIHSKNHSHSNGWER